MIQYIVKKGENYSSHPFKIFTGKKSHKIEVIFDESCIYDLGNNNQYDINKLWGVSFGAHQNNSIRIGWNWNLITKKIDLYWYKYQNGEFTFGYFKSYNINEFVTIDVYFDYSSSNFTFISDNMAKIIYHKYPFLKVGYYLYFYFGGNEVAPHDIIAHIDFY